MGPGLAKVVWAYFHPEADGDEAADLGTAAVTAQENERPLERVG
jgi:hypothetical protein